MSRSGDLIAVTCLMQKLKMPLRRIKRRVLLEINRPTNFGKTDLVHVISKRLRLANYLELCTRLTGNYYAEIDRSRFNTSRRLMYNCPENFDDGLSIDFKIADFDIGAAISKLKREVHRIDICLVDGWHTYDCAIRDLTCAYDLLADGGVLVVHDCLPPTELIASPMWVPGLWCGVSYRAYLDFVFTRSDLDYCTVNLDFGCGIIFKNRTTHIMEDASSSIRKPKLVADWFTVHKDDKIAFQFFMQNYTQLLRLISAKAFVHRLNRNLAKRLKSH
jgi:hypothetical protein